MEKVMRLDLLLLRAATPIAAQTPQAASKSTPAARTGTRSGVATALQTVDRPSGKLDFELGVPALATVTRPYDQMDYRSACPDYIWRLPIVAFNNLRIILEGTTGALPDDLTLYMGNEQSVFLTPNAITPCNKT